MKIKQILIIAFALWAYLHGPAAIAQVCDSVTVGSTDVVLAGNPPDNDANLSMVAIGFCDGSVRGQWQDTFGNGLNAFHIEITCVAVDNNNAWVSGVIKRANKGLKFLIGLPVITQVQDNGNAANGGIDKASLLFEAGDDQDCLFKPDLPLFDLSNGEVRIN
jgi:hypothetical protein